MRFNITIFLTILFLAGCRKNVTPVFQNVKGKLSGAAGCSSWIILQDDGTPRQPMNLDAFQVTLKSGQPVVFSYTISNTETVCMTGQAIELISIHDQ